jgi:uncharacterized membrane protein
VSEPQTRTTDDDAPLSAAQHPDPRALGTPGAVDVNDEVVGRTVTINRPRDELFAFWRDFQNLPRFMHEIERVTILDGVTSRWTVAAPAGQTVEWDATVTEEIPGEVIAWSSAPDASVRNSGRVEFRDAPGGRGTFVTVTMVYDPPVGTLGKLVAKLFQKEPKIQSRRDLRRFKQLMETGEVSTAQPPAAAPRAS